MEHNPAFDVIGAATNSVSQFAQTLISLATAILALSITFNKDVIKTPNAKYLWCLKLAWVTLLASICCGILTMRSVTQVPEMADYYPVIEIMTKVIEHVQQYQSAQLITFIFSLILIISYGWASLNKRRQPKK